MLAAVADHSLLRPGDRVLCALSGGADSVCLTHVLHALRGRLGIELVAAHFSHGIRPHAAWAERQLCQRLCDSLGLELVCGEGDTPAYAAHARLNLEMAARTLRYRFLGEEATGRACAVIATAHNRGDLAETVLMNLIRGAGTAGLRGMEAKAGRMIRPLLNVPRGDIEGYAAQNGLEYATDETNCDNAYTRNKIRNQIMPLLRELNPRAEASIARAAALAARDSDYLGAQAEALMTPLPAPLDRTTVFDAARLAAAHPAVSGRAVLMSCWRYSPRSLGRRHVEAVLALARSDDPGGRVDLPFGAVARREYGKLYIGPVSDASPAPPPALLTLGQTVRWGGWAVTASREPLANAWHFDAGALAFPVHIRQRQAGDALDRGGYHKSVKKLMIECKIPKNIRDIVPVLWDNNGVLCVGPYAADRGRTKKTPDAGTVSIGVEALQTEI